MNTKQTAKPEGAFKTKNISLANSEKIALISNLYTMLSSGIPILDTVESLLEDSKGNSKKLLLTMKSDLGQGQHLYYTFGKFPRIFDKVTVNIIKASEEAGTLDETLKDLVSTIRKDMEFNDKIRGAMMYPVFIIGLFFTILTVILVVVMPKISKVFGQLNVPLPLPTQIMIFLSNAILTYTIPIVIVIGTIIAGIVYLYKNHKKLFINALISLPLISKLAEQIDITRFTRGMFLLLSAGITITEALELCQEVVTKKDVQKAIKHCKDGVNAGKKLSEGMKDAKKVIPTLIIKMIEAGERSGNLDKAMMDASEFLDYQVSNTLKTVIALLEPIMLVFVGVLVGGMMMAIIAPMYSLIGQVGAH
jgi:type II secretory pathway component PulF